MKDLFDKAGNKISRGSVIKWNFWDSDDFVTWKFIGIVKENHVVYLGGGIDFGAAIGEIISYEEVIEQSEDNDDYDKGIEVIGKQSDIPKILEKGLTEENV